jgi:hypothetical protein
VVKFGVLCLFDNLYFFWGGGLGELIRQLRTVNIVTALLLKSWLLFEDLNPRSFGLVNMRWAPLYFYLLNIFRTHAFISHYQPYQTVHIRPIYPIALPLFTNTPLNQDSNPNLLFLRRMRWPQRHASKAQLYLGTRVLEHWRMSTTILGERWAVVSCANKQPKRPCLFALTTVATAPEYTVGTGASHRNPDLERACWKNGRFFLQLVSTLFREVKRGFAEPCKNVPL